MGKLLLICTLFFCSHVFGAGIQIVFDGNSLTDGVGASTAHVNSQDFTKMDYPAQCVRLFPNNYFASKYNFGVSGQTTQQMSADAGTQIDALYSTSYDKNILVVWEITNDLYFGATATEAYNHFVSYCQARKAVGWTVVIITVMPRIGFAGSGSDETTFETARNVDNGLLRSNYLQFSDGIADIGDNPNIVRPDGTHCNDAGYAIVANAVHDAIINLGVIVTPPVTAPPIINRGHKFKIAA